MVLKLELSKSHISIENDIDKLTINEIFSLQKYRDLPTVENLFDYLRLNLFLPLTIEQQELILEWCLPLIVKDITTNNNKNNFKIPANEPYEKYLLAMYVIEAHHKNEDATQNDFANLLYELLTIYDNEFAVNATIEQYNAIFEVTKKKSFCSCYDIALHYYRSIAELAENHSRQIEGYNVYKTEAQKQVDTSAFDSFYKYHNSLLALADNDITKIQKASNMRTDNALFHLVFTQRKNYFEQQIRKAQEQINKNK